MNAETFTFILTCIAGILGGYGFAHICLYAMEEDPTFGIKRHLKSTIPFGISFIIFVYIFKYLL